MVGHLYSTPKELAANVSVRLTLMVFLSSRRHSSHYNFSNTEIVQGNVFLIFGQVSWEQRALGVSSQHQH